MENMMSTKGLGYPHNTPCVFVSRSNGKGMPASFLYPATCPPATPQTPVTGSGETPASNNKRMAGMGHYPPQGPAPVVGHNQDDDYKTSQKMLGAMRRGISETHKWRGLELRDRAEVLRLESAAARVAAVRKMQMAARLQAEGDRLVREADEMEKYWEE